MTGNQPEGDMQAHNFVGLVALGALLWSVQPIRREQQLAVRTLWLWPVLMGLVCLVYRDVLDSVPPGAGVVAVILGGAAGVASGRAMFRAADRLEGTIRVRETPATLALWPGALIPALAHQFGPSGQSTVVLATIAIAAALLLAAAGVTGQRAYFLGRYLSATAGEDRAEST